jgi:cytochrome c oxidase subunit 2
VPVLFTLKSADVIHTFWVPRLAGKTQMIPGLINRQWLQADKPGIYQGLCSQYCGMQHAHMAVSVIAEDQDDFFAWEGLQRRPANKEENKEGYRIFMNRCASCHAISGTPASGTYGPDLTHLESRLTLAAGMLRNTRENLSSWVTHPQAIKPGARMPDFPLAPAEKTALIDYLSTLK